MGDAELVVRVLRAGGAKVRIPPGNERETVDNTPLGEVLGKSGTSADTFENHGRRSHVHRQSMVASWMSACVRRKKKAWKFHSHHILGGGDAQ